MRIHFITVFFFLLLFFLRPVYLVLPWVPGLSSLWILVTQAGLGMGSTLWGAS